MSSAIVSSAIVCSGSMQATLALEVVENDPLYSPSLCLLCRQPWCWR